MTVDFQETVTAAEDGGHQLLLTEETAWIHGINYDTASKNRIEVRKKFGYSIRCIKDE